MRTRSIESLKELMEVWELNHNSYVRVGYIEPQKDGLFISHKEFDLTPEGELYPLTETCYIRDRHGYMIGACSITLDSDMGLPCDSTFLHETDFIRDECRNLGWRLASSWRIITSEKAHKCVVGSLIDHTVQWANKNLVDIFLCAFNPKHVPFYERFLGMKEVARREGEAGLTNAPSVLMRWDRTEIEAWETSGSRFFCD